MKNQAVQSALSGWIKAWRYEMHKVDLHMHTTASDGKYTPSEIVGMAWKAGLRYIAITDHDSTEGIEEARSEAARHDGMTVIPGVEINSEVPVGELHMLGYFIDYKSAELTSTLSRLRNSRIERAKIMVRKLKNMGIKIDYERVEELAGDGAVGRPHVAQAMLEQGFVNSFKDAFLRFIGKGCPGYVDREKIEPADAIQLISRAGGIPVMAHPFTCENFEQRLSEWKDAGLTGLETYYNGYTPEQVEKLAQLADEHGLITTGGSDFHGVDSMNDPPLGTVEVPMSCYENLVSAKQRKTS
jgi:3',5'-nucleoside bisphosphate phosphatase